MSKSEEIEAKLDHLIEVSDWLVIAVKHLLLPEGEERITWGLEDDDAWLDDDLSPVDTSQFEHAAVRTRPAPKPPACRHRQQVLVGGMLRCADVDGLGCRFVFGGTGVRGKDATSPVPAPGHEDSFNHGTRV